MTESELNPYATPKTCLTENTEGVDSSFRLNLLSPTGRLGRLRYATFTTLVFFLIGIFMAILLPLSGERATGPQSLGPLLVLAPITVLAIKRCHDFNLTGWYSLPLVLPPLAAQLPIPNAMMLVLAAISTITSLGLMFIPGTKGSNRFGNETAPHSSLSIFIFIVLLILSGLVLTLALAGIFIS